MNEVREVVEATTDSAKISEVEDLKHEVHCLKYEVKKLKLKSKVRPKSIPNVEEHSVDVVSPNELEEI
jgi:hypothetical protein